MAHIKGNKQDYLNVVKKEFLIKNKTQTNPFFYMHSVFLGQPRYLSIPIYGFSNLSVKSYLAYA